MATVEPPEGNDSTGADRGGDADRDDVGLVLRRFGLHESPSMRASGRASSRDNSVLWRTGSDDNGSRPPLQRDGRPMLDVLYEDNHCLAVNKPAGLLRRGT